MKFPCQPADYFDNFLNLIPSKIDPFLKMSPEDFTRDRKLTFSKTVACTLSLTASGSSNGVDIKSGQFFKNARRSLLWPDTDAANKSSITKARNKIPFQIFEYILQDAVKLAYELWPGEDPQYFWHGMSVFATDGSKFNLPATEIIRQEFDPDSGLGKKGKGHFPQCLVSTLYDVFRRLPIARTIVPIGGSEREELKSLLPFVPKNSIWMFDRGYPSYEILLFLYQYYSGYFLFRCPATCTFPVVEEFVKSGKRDCVLYIKPSKKAKNKFHVSLRKSLKAIKVRAIILKSPDGTVSVLLTNLFNKKKFSCQQIIDLYFKRWRVEEYYRDEKVTFEIEKFHSRSLNGIYQELYSAMIISVITRCLMVLSSQFFLSANQECQFKNAALATAAEAAVFVPDDPEKAAQIFKELLQEIARVKYYRPNTPRPSQPRVSKRPSNKWKKNKIERCAGNA